MSDLIFLKLGGSLITDKLGVEAARPQVLARLAGEIAQAKEQQPDLRLLLGHGSGSFGHVPAAAYGTRAGVESAEQWRGFTEVSASALRLNRLVVEALMAAGVAAMSFQPSASAVCQDGRITSIALDPLKAALAAKLLPIIHGDVAFDTVRGGTIVSTEEVMMALASALPPVWLLLAGETAGVYDAQGAVIPLITRSNYDTVKAAVRGSRGTDVTGGMDSKVRGMLDLADAVPNLSIRIFSGLEAGLTRDLLLQPDSGAGTLIRCA